MSEQDILTTRGNIARGLRKVVDLYAELPWQVLASTNDNLFPGGESLNMLAGASTPQDWQVVYNYLEARDDRGLTQYADAQDEQHPVVVLAYWTRVIREQRGQHTRLDPTLSREVDYLQKNLDWMTRVDPFGKPEWYEVFEIEKDIRSIVRRLENLLSLGTRADTDAAPCFRDLADGTRCGGTLARVTLQRRSCEHVRMAEWYADNDPMLARRALVTILNHYPAIAHEHRSCDQGGRDDVYRCLKCDKPYTNTEYWLAVADHQEKQAAG